VSAPLHIHRIIIEMDTGDLVVDVDDAKCEWRASERQYSAAEISEALEGLVAKGLLDFDANGAYGLLSH
jgi:hypothetical protein